MALVWLKRFCGKGNVYLHHLVSCVRTICNDELISIKVDYYQNEIMLFATSQNMDRVEKVVYDALECGTKTDATGQESVDRGNWARVTFLTPDAAQRAVALNESEFKGSILKAIPLQVAGDHKVFPLLAVRATVVWPRRQSNGFAIVKCDMDDVGLMVDDFSNLIIGGRNIRCEPSKRSMDSVVISGLNKDLSENEILDLLRTATSRRILDFFSGQRGCCRKSTMWYL
ncbi:hypothetical protein M0R45_004984 [Rubus argutus]|uniref:RRM domain-containing protein n=1 Tax=Rubus argutus TaxID=59490 RepID=A0AAW1YLW0_RUBAR